MTIHQPDPTAPVPAEHPEVTGPRTSAIHEATAAFTGSVRQALRAIFGSDRPGGGELVERLQISRTLAWRLQQMVKPDDLGANLNAIVGERGYRVMIAALAAAGTPADRLDEIGARWAELRAVMDRSRIDRDGLRALSADDAASTRSASDAMRLRKAATSANQTLWGIGIRASVFMQMFAPSPKPSSAGSDRIGIAASLFDHGLRVLRSVPPLIVYQRLFRGQFGDRAVPEQVGNHDDPWIHEASTPGLFGTAVRPRQDLPDVFELETGLIPPSTPIDLAFAESALDFASPYADAPGDSGFMEAPVGFPVERVIVYLGTHASMPPWTDHECRLRTSLLTSRRLPPQRRFATLPLQIRLESVPLTDGVPALPPGSEALKPAIGTITSIHADRLGHPASAFRFLRAVVDYPPMPSFLSLRWRLAERPA